MGLREIPIGATSRLELAHYDKATERYRLHPIDTYRPLTGVVETTMLCPTCGADVPLRLLSKERVRARRRRQFRAGTLGVLLQVAISALLIALGFQLDLGAWSTLPYLVGSLALLMTPIIWGAHFRESRTEDGAAVLDRGHTLREHHDTIAVGGEGGEAGL